jgi:hypothetical protein
MEVKIKSYTTMAIRYRWYVFDSKYYLDSTYDSVRINMYGPIGLMHMINGIILDWATFETLSLHFLKVISNLSK